MGIKGLLPFIAEAKERVHLRDLSGRRLVVDAYVWLHRGARSCASDICAGHRSTQVVAYALSMVSLFRTNGVEPVLVFDGASFPCKEGTEHKRQRARSMHLARASYFEHSGRDPSDAYFKAIDITPALAYELVQALRQRSVEYIVAPYEGDALLAHLVRTHHVWACVTEDSDLLAYHCPRVLFKMDRAGNSDLVEFDKLRLVLKPWDRWVHLFTDLCIFAGCDYLDAPKGVGIKTAHSLLDVHRSTKAVLLAMHSSPSIGLDLSTPSGRKYVERFRVAQLIFAHAPVYDVDTRTVVYSRQDALDDALRAELQAVVPLPNWTQQEAISICEIGDMDPNSREHFERGEAAPSHPGTAMPHPAATVDAKKVSPRARKQPKLASLAEESSIRSSARVLLPFNPPALPPNDYTTERLVGRHSRDS